MQAWRAMLPALTRHQGAIQRLSFKRCTLRLAASHSRPHFMHHMSCSHVRCSL